MKYFLARRQSILITTLIVIYVVVFTVFTVGRYTRYNATGWDLGIFTQLTWNAAHGRFLHNTIAEQNNMLGIHAPYITIILAPLMWLWADPRMLVIAQTLILGLGAWPIARLAGRVFTQWWVPVFFAALWLLYPPLGWINRWDFHEIAPAATFFAFAFYAADRRAWRQTDVWLLLALLCKEEIGLNVAGFAVYMAWRYHRQRGVCTAWFVIGMAWFIGHAFVIFPALREVETSMPIHAVRYEWLLSGDPQRIWDYLSGSVMRLKVTYVIELFAPLAFVPLAAPVVLIPALPTFALSVLSSYEPQGSIYLHHNAAVIPVLLAAAIFGLAWISRRFKHGLAGGVLVLACASLVAWVIYNPIFGSSEKSHVYGWESGAHRAALDEVRTLIPAGACVVAENNIQPHYSVRDETYVIGARGSGPQGDGDGCTYMIVDLGDRRFDDFVVGEEVACYQFWSQKRAPIYFRDTVVVLQWMPADPDPAAWQQMDAYCAAYAAGQ
jgi:uncharacterized membrane protein